DIVTDSVYKNSGNVVGDLQQVTLRAVDQSDNTVGSPATTIYEYDDNGNRIAEMKLRTLPSGTLQYVRKESTFDAQNSVRDTVIKIGSTQTGPWTTVPNTDTHTTYNNIGKPVTITDGYGRV